MELYMANARFNFPRGFLWGTATSSHQVEGNNANNNWWAWEQETDRILHGDKSGLACDWWGGRWRDDMDRAAESGQNAHRLSIEWSRVQPTPERWDEEAIDQYRGMLRGLQERGITAMVTLHHFTDPIWFAELGGWEGERAVELFEAYVIKVVEALHEYNNLWVTINEPNVLLVYGYLLGLFPPGKESISSLWKVSENLIRAHSAAYHAIHQKQPTARVGIAINYRGAKPARSWNPLDRDAAHLQKNFFNNMFPNAIHEGILRFPFTRRQIKEAKGTQDFLGIDYYTRDHVAFNLLRPRTFFTRRYYRPDAELSETGFIAHEPEGMFEALKWGLKFNIPIIVTENGVDSSDDMLRPKYIIEHLHQIWRGINFNWPVKGYFHWTLVDNFEWERGWTQRFGLWELDRETQGRKKRLSAELYAQICQQNGISSDMVAKYAPDIFAKIFPGLEA